MKLEKDHAVIETAEEAAAIDEGICSNFMEYYGMEHVANHAEVLEAITAEDLENDPLFLIMKNPEGVEYIRYFPNGIGGELLGAVRLGVFEIFKANAITTGKTVGELRELLEWAKGK